MLKGCREFLGEGVCAADLAGDEAAWPMEKFAELFKEAKKLEYPYTIHAGECGRAENILGAVELGACESGPRHCHGQTERYHGCLQKTQNRH